MLERLWKKIIRRKGFTLLSIPAFFLWIFSLIYRFIFYLNKKLKGKPYKLNLPVVSVGNITVGGTGKTPLVYLIACELINEKVKVGIVSSGYGRKSNESILLSGEKLIEKSVSETGDEVWMLAEMLPEAVFSIAQSKTEAAIALERDSDVDVVIVDDGFQHFGLDRDIDIVTYDAALKKRVLKPFPYGVMRESRKSFKRADIIIITRAKFAKDLSKIRSNLIKINQRADIYHAGFNATEISNNDEQLSVKFIADKSVLLFAGVGNFKSLKKQVKSLAGDLDEVIELPDHVEYTPEIINMIKEKAEQFDSDLILTTQKDWVKLSDIDFGCQIYYLNLSIDMDPGEEKLIMNIIDRLNLKNKGI